VQRSEARHGWCVIKDLGGGAGSASGSAALYACTMRIYMKWALRSFYRCTRGLRMHSLGDTGMRLRSTSWVTDSDTSTRFDKNGRQRRQNRAI
jgi:hypothetical protein